MQPVATESADQLTIKPAVTIGNPILEAFSEEAQRRRFPNSMQNPSVHSEYLIKIATKSKDNNSFSQYVEFGQSRNLDVNCSNAEVYHPTVDRALSQSNNESQIPKSLKLSDNLVRSLQMFQHNNISLKNFRSQSVNNRDKTRKISGSNSGSNDRMSKKSNASNSNVRITNFLPSSKKDRENSTTEKNISKSKSSNIRNTSSKKQIEYHSDKFKRTEPRLEKNMTNRNDTINNTKEINAENNPLMTQEKSIDVIRQIDNLVCKFIAAKHMVCRQNNSTAVNVSIEPLYMTTSKITTVTNDTNIDRNYSVTDVHGKSKSPRRRHGSAYQKYHDKYLTKLITSSTMKTSTESAVDARTSTILKNTSLKNIDEYVTKTWNVEKKNMTESVTESNILFNKTDEQRNLRENYIETKNNNLEQSSTEDFFVYKIKKDSEVSNYYNKYLKRVASSKRITPMNANKINEHTMTVKYDRAQLEKAASFVSKRIRKEQMPATAETNKNDYSLLKTEKLLYESKSPKVKIRQYYPVIDDEIEISNISTSNYNTTQQNRGNKKCKQSNISSEKFYENNENSIQNDNKFDSELINSDEMTSKSLTADDCTRMISQKSQEPRKTLEEESKDDFDVVMLNSTTTDEIVTRDANESREKAFTERHGKRKHKSRHNGRKNNRSKKRKKNHDAKRKRKPTSTVAWKVDEPTSDDYDNAHSSERAKMFSHNDPEYDKADDNRNTSGRNDWYLTDEITTESFKTELSNVDESVSKYPTEDSIHDGLQSEETTNVNLVTSNITSHLSTASNEKVSKKCKVLTTTESNWLSWWTNDNKKTDKESTECEEDVTSFPTTSDLAEEETSYYSTSVSDHSSTYDTISKSDSTSINDSSSTYENRNISNEEMSTIYSTIKDEENNDKKDMTSKSILEESDKSNEGTWSWNQESITHSVTGGTTHDVNSDLDSEEEEDAETEKPISDEDNEIDNDIGAITEDYEIDNDVVAITEDYEIDNCSKTQHACDKYTCIEEDQVCDGIVDCLNASDETDCDYIYFKRLEEHLRTNKLIEFTSNVLLEDTLLDGCNSYKHPCDGTCIDVLNVCDGKRDCLDGTDEENCTEGIPYVENNISCESWLLFRYKKISRLEWNGNVT